MRDKSACNNVVIADSDIGPSTISGRVSGTAGRQPTTRLELRRLAGCRRPHPSFGAAVASSTLGSSGAAASTVASKSSRTHFFCDLDHHSSHQRRGVVRSGHVERLAVLAERERLLGHRNIAENQLRFNEIFVRRNPVGGRISGRIAQQLARDGRIHWVSADVRSPEPSAVPRICAATTPRRTHP